MSQEELNEILAAHAKWLANDSDGVRADLMAADLRGLDLKFASLSGAGMALSDLREADLHGADLSYASLRDARLQGANLRNTSLRQADLRGVDLDGVCLKGAYFYGAVFGREVPMVTDLHIKILAAIEAGGGLEMMEWHTCETTHCRAGWAIHLAGEEGYKLEGKVGGTTAGALIHLKSCPWLDGVPDFYATNEAALFDIRRCAEIEKGRKEGEK